MKKLTGLLQVLSMRKLHELDKPPGLPQKHKPISSLPSMRPPRPKGNL